MRQRVAAGLVLTLVMSAVPLASAAVASGLTSPPVGSPRWHAALIEGASTSVPLDASPGYVDLDGQPFSVQTHITGVEFHVPGVASGAPGGMSAVPHPVLHDDNGVKYWRVSGELSAVVVDYLGFRLAVGPVDSSGVNHRFDSDGVHPRAMLPGAHFILRYPVRGFNGRMVTHQAPNDGGFIDPAAPLTQVPVDVMAMLDRGYGLFTVALGGTVNSGDVDGVDTVDTNPDSGTGIFWGGELRSYSRPVQIGPDGTETAYPQPSLRSYWVPELAGYDQLDLGDPDFGVDFGEYLQYQPELVRDGVVVGKRLLQQLTRSDRAPWTVFLGWSGSGGTATVLNSGRVSNLLPMGPGDLPYNGGNFNRFHDPQSGRRFDAFLLYAPLQLEYSFAGDLDYRPYEVDDQYPVGAPSVFIAGDADLFHYTISGLIYANNIARALPGSKQHRLSLRNTTAVYAVEGLTHSSNDYSFMNDLERRHRGDLRYERSGEYPNPDGFNTRGHGHLVQPAFVEMAEHQPSVLDDDFQWNFAADIPRTTPLFLQSIENLHSLTTRGTPLPISRVETELFAQLDSLSPGDMYPLYPRPCAPMDLVADPSLDVGQALVDCAAGIEQDSVIGLLDADGFALPIPLDEHELDEVRYFADSNPLPRMMGSIVVPDMATALGPHLIFAQSVIERRLTDEQLRSGFVAADGRVYQFSDHRAYVKAYRRATDALIEQRLWDRRMGGLYLAEAAQSDVLR